MKNKKVLAVILCVVGVLTIAAVTVAILYALTVARTVYAENHNDKGVAEAEKLLKSIGRPYTDPKANQQPIVVTPPTPSQ